MTTFRPLVRIASAVAALALTTTGLAVIASPAVAAPGAAAAAAPERVYNSMPAVLPPSYPSLGFAATATAELGDFVQLGGTQRALSSVSVSLTDWACESDFSLSGTTWTAAPAGTPCVTTPGATFTHPITVNVYDVDNRGALPKLGALISTVTQNVAVPFRPSASSECATATQWIADNGVCANGLAFKADFPLVDHPVVSGDVIISVAYNTNTHGLAPLTQAGPYDSLNLSLRTANASIGKDENIDEMFLNSSYAPNYGDHGDGGVNTLRADTGWTGSHGLVMTVNADDSFIPTQTQTSTVRQVDVKSTENASTYTSWHEGYNTPGYVVKADGLHLGETTRSQVIKGTDVATSQLSETALRTLLASAKVTVASGSATLQLPVFAGSSYGPSTPFTTLRSSSLSNGTRTFSLNDTWTTSKAISGYAAGASAPLGDLLDALYSSNDKVWLAGFGVQAESATVVRSIAWGTTTYTFAQPVTQECSAITAGQASTSIAAGGWTFAGTGTQGSSTYTSTGLRVATTGDAPTSGTDQRTAAGSRAVSVLLKDAGVPTLNTTATSGAAPRLQLGVDFDADGTTDATLTRGATADYVLADSAPAFVADAAPSTTGGSAHGTLDGWLASFPDAKVTSVGYSLSGAVGSATISSIEVGCVGYAFSTATAPAPTVTETINDQQIRKDESVYTGWHEGYTNTTRAFSVKTNGLHLGDGGASQIINGLVVPATAGLESFVTSTSVDVVSGGVSLQIPVFYGATVQRFTTLRLEGLATGVSRPSVSDMLVSSSAIRTDAGVTVYPAGTRLAVADWSAALASLGNVKVLAYGVQANASAVVKSITGNGVMTTFSPVVTAAPTQIVRVLGTDIRPNEATYNGWHEGYTNPTAAYKVAEAGLTLAVGDKRSQILYGTPASNIPSAASLIDTASVVVGAGSVTYQVPVFYGPVVNGSQSFTTLRSDSLGVGTWDFDLTSKWRSSRAIGSTISAGGLYALGDILDAMTDVRWLGFGVQAETASTVESITWSGIQYQFAGGLSPVVPTITGTPTFGQTLTANAGTWGPVTPDLSYQWKANGAPIADATGSTYVLQAGDVGKTVVVTVTGSLPGYTDVSKTSTGVTIAAATLTTVVPTISGAVEVGKTLTATTGTWGPGTVGLAVQWLKNGTVISGATSATYVVGETDIEAVLSVRVTGTKAGYTTVSTVSLPTITVPAPPAAPNSSPVYRFYSASKQAHFFTASAAERDDLILRYSKVWTYEGIAYNGFDSGSQGAVPLYRFWSEKLQSHFYTTSVAERDSVIAQYKTVWNYEGIAYYVNAPDAPTGQSVYRFLNLKTGHHFYTASDEEKASLVANASKEWKLEGIAYKVPVDMVAAT